MFHNNFIKMNWVGNIMNNERTLRPASALGDKNIENRKPYGKS